MSEITARVAKLLSEDCDEATAKRLAAKVTPFVLSSAADTAESLGNTFDHKGQGLQAFGAWQAASDIRAAK